MGRGTEFLTRPYEIVYPNFPSIVAFNKDRFPLSRPARGFVLTGDVCTGSTTLARELAQTIGVVPYLVGEEIRTVSDQLGVKWSNFPVGQLERIYADTEKKIRESDRLVVEGRFVGNQAADIDDIIKIICTAHPQAVLQRYMKREHIKSKKKGLIALNERLNADRSSMVSVYGGPTIGELFDRNLFDVVVDTTFSSANQIAKEIMNLIGFI